jgi:glycosyltransferase involved in cell wall biosynthesis
LRITANTVDHLCHEFDFKIVTRDRDLGDDKPYPDIKINQWQRVGNADVYYLPPQSNTIKEIFNIIVNTPHQILYLNSFFEPFTIKALLNRKLRGGTFKSVIVVPWGEFGWASLKQKYLKKFVFIQLARLIGLYDRVIWRASSEFEKIDITKVMKIKSDDIHITGDLPIKNIPNVSQNILFPQSPDSGLKIVFLSRISREKNLDYALKILKKVKAMIVFDIYGPAENEIYWKECQELIGQLPANVIVSYLGRVDANQVVPIFSCYDLFLFPTGGEAYGHVIAECLTAGTPVLISTETPWRNLQNDGLGWDIDLTQENSFVEVIEKAALVNHEERLKKRSEIKAKIVERLFDPHVLETNRQLFKKCL